MRRGWEEKIRVREIKKKKDGRDEKREGEVKGRRGKGE